MIRMEAKVSGVSFNSIAYHRFDIEDESQIVTWETVTKGDENKFIMFDDGSELYARVYFMSGKGRIGTSCGTYYIPDIVHCWQPKAPKSSYSGEFKSNVSLAVVPLGRQERSIVTRVTRGEKMKSLTPRLEEGVTNIVQQQVVELGYDVATLDRDLTKELIGMAMSDRYTPQKLKAVENMKRMLANVDITKLETDNDGPKRNLGAIEEATTVTETNTTSEDDETSAVAMLAKLKGA